MRKLSAFLALLVGLAVPSALLAQDADAPSVLRLSFYQCDLTEIGPVVEAIEAQQMPIWNDLVEEGMIDSYGHLIHAWADEWNFGIYTVGESVTAIIDAQTEFGERMQGVEPDPATNLNAVCPAHRDNFYFMGPSTGDDEEGDGGN